MSQSGGPASYYAYQNAVYEQIVNETEYNSLYEKAVADISQELLPSEIELYFSASIQELRGRQFLFFGKTEETRQSVEKGITFAEQSAAIKPTAYAYAVLSALYSLKTKVVKGSTLSNGLKIDEFCKKALKLDPDNSMAGHLLAARYIYAPPPFRNIKKGIETAKTCLQKAENAGATKVELFNLKLCIAHAYYLLKDSENIEIWFENAGSLFPQNLSILDREEFTE